MQYFAPLHGAVGSCAVSNGSSWPAEDTVSVYTDALDNSAPPTRAPDGTVNGMAFYIADAHHVGPGVAMTLSIPRLHVLFLVGASDRTTATALLQTLHDVPAGTPLN